MRYPGVVVFVVVFGLACEDATAVRTLPNPEFSVGQGWLYEWHVRSVDSAGAVLFDERDSVRVWVSATDATIGSMTGLIVLEAMSTTDASSGTSTVWYRHTADELTEIAYRNAGATPVVFMKSGMPVRGRSLRSVFDPGVLWGPEESADTMIIRSDPRVVLRYPLTVGASWTAFSDPFLQTRQVTRAFQRETVGGGIAVGVEVSTRIAFFREEDSWVDEVSNTGLLSRTLVIHTLMTDQASPESGQPVIYTETLAVVAMW